MAAKSSPKSTKRTTKRPPAVAAETTTTAETANVESMSTGATTTSIRTPSHDEIARRAYELFLARGRQHGRAHEDWMTAERELRARYSVN